MTRGVPLQVFLFYVTQLICLQSCQKELTTINTWLTADAGSGPGGGGDEDAAAPSLTKDAVNWVSNLRLRNAAKHPCNTYNVAHVYSWYNNVHIIAKQTKYIILKPKYIILKPKYIILKPKYIILKPKYIILKPKYIILKPKYIILNFDLD